MTGMSLHGSRAAKGDRDAQRNPNLFHFFSLDVSCRVFGYFLSG